ncbi:MAG: DUF58 domain-containing protein [Nitrospirae bacterium]|nr:DUF58 domain-containing protein [Nitrospirota bacterium]
MKLTREGKRFLLASVLIAVAAVNTGNNLIYLILSLMLSFIVLSYLILRLNLAGLSLDVSVAGAVYAGEPVSVKLHVHNKKKLPVYSVIIAAQDAAAEVYCGQISGHGVFRGTVVLVFGKRGLYGYRNFVVQSGFPFILFRKSISVEVSGQVLVYPKLLDVREVTEVIEGRQQEGAVAVRGRGDEVYSLRAFQYGDDWRRIHWKASAKQAGFLIREYAEYASQKITLLLDNLLPQDSIHFEAAVSAAASLAKQYIETGYPVQFIAVGTTIPFGTGEDHLRSILGVLSVIAPEEGFADFSEIGEDGFSIAILQSSRSRMRAEAALTDIVIYADSL